jgi:exosortase family protein XrtF
MVLFVAFVLAFYRGWKTIVYLAVSLVFLFLINCIRIAGLNIIYLDHPDYIKIAHDYAFPAIIYGSVVVLWLIWIKVFALKNENN